MSDAGELKRVGLRATLPRLRILDLFEETPQQHLSAEDVYRLLLEKEVEVGLATVYRVLTQLQQAGLLKHARFDAGKAVFELEDGLHHDHLICTDCGRLQEFHDPLIESLQKRAAIRLGFELGERTLVLHCRCSNAACAHRSGHRSSSHKIAPS